jgi:hypothetical protein
MHYDFILFYGLMPVRGGQLLLVEETGVLGENHRPAASH